MDDNAPAEPLDIRGKVKRLVARWSALKDLELYPPPAKDPTEEEIDWRDEVWLAPPTPYPGLRSFAPNETTLFFARQRQINGLVQRLADNNIIAVLGGSGCGKSSLVRAGLIPHLSTTAAVPGRKGSWYAIEFRPGDDLNAALIGGIRDSIISPVAKFKPDDDRELGRRALVSALALDSSLENAEEETVVHEAMRAITSRLFETADGDDLRSAKLDVDAVLELARGVLDRIDIRISRGARAGPPNLLILVDQFEEAFRPEVSVAGFGNLHRLLDATFHGRPDSLYIALTLRSEELHRCAEAGLANIITESAYLLGPLSDEQDRRQIIVEPARAVFADWIWNDEPSLEPGTAPFDDKVVEVLLAESLNVLNGGGHKSDYLPLLQHALQRLWDSSMLRWQSEVNDNQSPDLRIQVDDLKRITNGDVNPGFLNRCLNKHANQAYEEALREAAKHFSDGSEGRKTAALVVWTIFSAMARRDDRGNWARRSVGIEWIVELLGEIDVNAPASREAAADVLRIFLNHGYLNVSGPEGKEKYEVSHEALIRNWTRYVEWLHELEAVEYSVREVASNLEKRRKKDAMPRSEEAVTRGGFRRVYKAALDWLLDRKALDWLLERREKRAAALITDQYRESIGKVVGDQKKVSIGLAAALLADSERRRSARLMGAAREDGSVALHSMQADDLENAMRARIKEMEPDWKLADVASKRSIPRLAYATILTAFLGVFLLGGWALSLLAGAKLERSQNRLYFGAVAAAGNLGERWLEAGAFELKKAHAGINEHRDEEEWTDGQPATKEMELTIDNWERAARKFTGAVVFRKPAIEPDGREQADCTTSGPKLLRDIGRISLGVRFDQNSKSWRPAVESNVDAPEASSEILASESDLVSVGNEGDIICLSRKAPLLMNWPKDAQAPRFWMLGLRCRKFGEGVCISWLPNPQPLDTAYSKIYASKESKTPWQLLWPTNNPRNARSRNVIFDFEEPLRQGQARIGFAFKLDEKNWAVADTTPGVLEPYIVPDGMDRLSILPDSTKKCEDKADCMEFKTGAASARFDYAQVILVQGSEKPDPCTSGEQRECRVVITIGAVPSEGNQPLSVWSWTFSSTPMDVSSINTNGRVLEFSTMDGLWRRGVVGVNALAEHVNILAGSEEPHPNDVSKACQSTGCMDWSAPDESAWEW